jgi:hydroxyacylglutathione hydrolase
MSSKLMPVRRRGDAARAPRRVSDGMGMDSRLVGSGDPVGAHTSKMTVDFETDAPVYGNLDVTWIHGSPDIRRPTDPPVQVHRYDEHTYLLRQSKDRTFEAPFVFLLFGNERALLLDTGAVRDRGLRGTVDGLITDWLQTHPNPAYQLVVAHTHGHGDHVAGDASFADRPQTAVVGRSAADVRAFFGFLDWPAQIVTFDLGGRVLELTGIPGHHEASLLVWDRWTGLLFTGDSVYPGRLYVPDMPAFVDSMERAVRFAESRRVSHLLGCHVEMSLEPARDYFPGCRYQPHEPPLQMTVAQLRTVHEAAVAVAARPGIHRFDDFAIYNGMGLGTNVRLAGRSLVGTARARLTGHRAR